MNKKTFYLSFLLLVCTFSVAQSQDDMAALEADLLAKSNNKVIAAFKTSRVINNASLEFTAPGVLDFKITHRFGTVQRGFYDIFGLDQAAVRIGLDYGINDKLMIGLGRTGFDKTYDGYFRYKMLSQTTDNKIPLTLLYVGCLAVNTTQFANKDINNYFLGRLGYTHQLILGRKFSEGLSLQLMPTLVHRNMVNTQAEANTVFALGIAGRQKINKRISFNAEYFILPANQLSNRHVAPLSLGFDIETGGHVFQLHFTNAISMHERGFITETTDSWAKGDFRFGFNISRVFTLKDPNRQK